MIEYPALKAPTKKMTGWREDLKNAIKGCNHEHIKKHYSMDSSAQELFPTVISDNQLAKIDWENPTDPLMKQFIPHPDENLESPNFIKDPVGDTQASKNNGIIDKYKGRVLLIASGSCAVNCRYCFRRHFNYKTNFAPRNNWQSAVQYITSNPSIHEVILSGGDPLTLDTTTLQSLSQQLESIEHVTTLRIHSRIPCVLPNRIDSTFLQWLDSSQLNIVMVLHINHIQELNEQAKQAIFKLNQTNITLLNQSVLLKDVNDNTDALVSLSHQLFSLKILPYYLHLFDRTQNASHFEVPYKQAVKLHKDMMEQLPGYLVPKLVKEQAGHTSKTWINQ